MSATKRVTIDFPEELYKTIKALTAFQDSSIREFVLNAINKDLSHKKIKVPNLETLKTFEDTDKGLNFENYENFNELLEDIKKQS